MNDECIALHATNVLRVALEDLQRALSDSQRVSGAMSLAIKPLRQGRRVWIMTWKP